MNRKFALNFKLFFNQCFHTLLIYILLLLVFAVFRTIFLIFFNDSPELYHETSDIIKAYFYGFRFDTMTILYGLLPVMIINLLFLFSDRFVQLFNKIFRIYYTILIFIFIIIAIVNLYFYNFFMTNINVLIFGLVQDDTAAVVKSIWTDYPVAIWLIVFSIVIWLVYIMVKIIQKARLKKVNLSFITNFILFLTLCFFFILGIRGTFDFYPLKINDSIISQHVFINNMVPNGVYSLKTAIADRKEKDVNVDIGKTMKNNGFGSPQEAVSSYLEKSIADNPDSLVHALFSETPDNEFLKNNPPNVVFVLMESMSENFISLHNKQSFNLLGNLENVLPGCIHFTHFLPSTGATIHSLEGLMVNSPMTPIAQSIYLNKKLETSAAKPFKENGYHTAFVTGSKLGWRNLDKFVPNQYFDDVEGSAYIEKYVENTQSNEWGCYDEFLFKRMYDKLQSNTGKPQFIFALTTTNHTPYSLPDTYKPYSLEIPQNIVKKLSSDPEHAKVHFLTYQYANDCLGKFIEQIKNSPLGENTIIVASGDHNARRIFDYADAYSLQKYGVPLILYIPEKYKPAKEFIHPDCFGSHKDIFPTVYHLSLSKTSYVKSGINLFNPEEANHNFAMAEYNVLMNNTGCVYFKQKPIFYAWKDSTRTLLRPAKGEEIQSLNKTLLKGKSYIASMTYLVQTCLSEH